MKRRVKVSFTPKAKKGLEARTSGLEVRMSPGLGYNANQLSWPVMAGEFSEPRLETNSTLKPVPREEANLEAEVGETAYTDLNGDGLPEHYKIGGKRHSQGGTPLYLPDNSFIFSRDRSMKIKDPSLLNQFGMPPKKGGYTPADIAKKYDINKYRKVLADSDTDDLQRKNAEQMISKYNLKLGKLALAQESIKGFPQGIPAIAIPYMEHMGIQPEQLVQGQPQQMSQQEVDTEEYEDQPVESEEEVMMPEARYGMNIMPQLLKRNFGGDLNRFVRGGSSKRRVRVTMPKFQKGGSNAPGVIKYETLDDLYADPNARTLVESGKAYVKDPKSGKYKRVDRLPGKIDYENREDLEPLRNDKDPDRDFRDDYAYLENELLINAEARAAIYNNYKQTIEDDKKLTQAEQDKLLAKDETAVINDFLALQKHNMALQAKGKNFTEPKWGNKNQPQLAYNKYIAEAGLSPLDNLTIKSGQAAYIGFVQAAKDDETKQYFTYLKPEKRGRGDEKYIPGEGQLSPIDGIYGDTTAGQLALPDIEAKFSTELTEPEAVKPPSVKHLPPPAAPGAAPFWLQDVIKTKGAARDLMGIEKYMPWQAVPQTFLPEPTFYDPSRELASAEEQAAMLTEGLAAFTGPQALSARASAIQGQTARAAADILGKYNNLNVGVANQFELQKTSILNNAAREKAALATQLYDKVTIANQQFDAATQAARENLRNSYIQSITNRANTYNMNTLFPQYSTDPSGGGFIEFTQGAPLDPEYSEDESIDSIYRKLYQNNPTMRSNPEKLWATAEKMYGLKSGNTNDNKMAEWFAKTQGYQGE